MDRKSMVISMKKPSEFPPRFPTLLLPQAELEDGVIEITYIQQTKCFVFEHGNNVVVLTTEEMGLLADFVVELGEDL